MLPSALNSLRRSTRISRIESISRLNGESASSSVSILAPTVWRSRATKSATARAKPESRIQCAVGLNRQIAALDLVLALGSRLDLL
jgi:hypothetical protein